MQIRQYLNEKLAFGEVPRLSENESGTGDFYLAAKLPIDTDDEKLEMELMQLRPCAFSWGEESVRLYWSTRAGLPLFCN